MKSLAKKTALSVMLLIAVFVLCLAYVADIDPPCVDFLIEVKSSGKDKLLYYGAGSCVLQCFFVLPPCYIMNFWCSIEYYRVI